MFYCIYSGAAEFNVDDPIAECRQQQSIARHVNGSPPLQEVGKYLWPPCSFWRRDSTYTILLEFVLI